MATLDWKLIQETYTPPGPSDGYTYRAEVPGGWLVAVWAGKDIESHAWGGGVTFVPDPMHAWQVADRTK